MLDVFEVFTQNRFYLELYLGESDSLTGSNALSVAKSLTGLDGYFMEVSGLKYECEAIDFWEVTPQKWGIHDQKTGRLSRMRIPAGTSPKIDITLKRGMNISLSMWSWIEAVREGHWSTRRRDGDLIVLDQSGFEKARFRFTGAWPKSYEINPAKVDGDDFQVETVVLACDDFYRVDYTKDLLASAAMMASSAAGGLVTGVTTTAAQELSKETEQITSEKALEAGVRTNIIAEGQERAQEGIATGIDFSKNPE